ncbi:hypothetical protein BGZ83_006299 [Gryganskiella cystojenkinii]|nr:hypothetical protein BGZ83_006299 [Gryganskiella cystojenkinii]
MTGNIEQQQTNGLDHTGGSNNTQHSHVTMPTSGSYMNNLAMNPVFEDTSASHLFPYHELVPPPTQGLFRSLMEELQAQAALQRDQFLAATAKSGLGPEVMEHHNRALPKFMMEPFDFLSEDYNSCTEPQSSGSHSLPTNNMELQLSTSINAAALGRSGSIASASEAASLIEQVSSPGGRSKKRPLADDPYNFDDHADSTTTPPPGATTGHDQLSPPTQDLFRMLMEELETQAAIQRDQALASNTKADSESSMNAFNGSHHNQHHTRLPRFVMEPFDFLTADYGSMPMDGSGSTQATQESYMSSMTSGNTTNGHHPSTPPPMHTSQEYHLSPPTQDLFRTLMEELEVQAAFQRDQVLAATTKSAPRIDPEEYAFNGQHLRPLPRFMFEPLDFLSADYESCMTSDHSGSSSSSHGAHFFDPVRNSYMDVDFMGSSSSSSHSSSASTTAAKSTIGSRSKSHHQQNRPKPVITIAKVDKAKGSAPSSRPSAKKRKLAGVSSSNSDPSSSLLAASAQTPGSAMGSETSPVSPTFLSALSISVASPDSATSPIDESSPTPTGSSKRPWTPEDEALLLKLFSKKVPINDIARTLDRTVHSVRSRRQILTDPGFVKGKGHGVSRRCRQDPETTIKLPTYAQMAFLSLAWLPEMEGTLNDVATMVERLFSRYLNRIPRTGHKNLQIWRAQISDALAHEKGQPRPRFESFGLKRGRQWVYRLTAFGKGMVEAMGGVEEICEDLLKNNAMENQSASPPAEDDDAQDAVNSGGSSSSASVSGDVTGSKNVDSNNSGVSQVAGAGIGQGMGYGYSYRPPDFRQKSVPKRRPRSDRRKAAKLKKLQQQRAEQGLVDGGAEMEVVEPVEGDNGVDKRFRDPANAIPNAMEAMAMAVIKMMALETAGEKNG